VSDDGLTTLRAEFDRLEAALKSHVPASERNALSGAIVALFKRTEVSIADLAAFKERIRELVEAFKALPSEGSKASARHDHLGASTFIERGWSALAAGEWKAAEADLRQAVALDSTSTTAPALLGWALMHQDRLDDALQVCLTVLLREPEQGLAQVAVGAVCLRKGIIGEAIEHLSRAAARNGDARAALYANFWLGVAYLERDMQSDAVEFLRRAVTQGPNLAEGWAELGRALWLRGQHAEADEAWKVGAGIRHSPHAKRCTELLAAVAAGGAPPRSPLG
jgi:tetratricopeptide (TPR) repeat protein